MLTAITRAPSPRLAECELTHLARYPIDIELARRQHAAYCSVLVRLGCTVIEARPEPDLPDAMFVEDTAIVLDELAIITRPAVPHRRRETASVAALLGRWRHLEHIEAPATIDGGDVLRRDRTLLVGVSRRTSAEAVDQLRGLVAPHGYEVHPVAVTGCLHLKTACTAVSDDVLVVNPAWLDREDLAAAAGDARILEVPAEEPGGANHLLVGDTVLSPASCPRTVEGLRRLGINVEVIDFSEPEKAEAGLTCCSVVFPAPPTFL